MWQTRSMDPRELLQQLRFAAACVTLTVALGWFFAGSRAVILSVLG